MIDDLAVAEEMNRSFDTPLDTPDPPVDTPETDPQPEVLFTQPDILYNTTLSNKRKAESIQNLERNTRPRTNLDDSELEEVIITWLLFSYKYMKRIFNIILKI